MTNYAFANQGGSAGKTTSCDAIAVLLATRSNLRVRVVDLDGQANTTQAFGIIDPASSVSDVLMGRKSIAEVEVPTRIEGLTLVPATDEVNRTALDLGKGIGGEQRLKTALRTAPPVDVTFFDCGGAMNIITVAALVASQKVFTVTRPGIKEMGGIPYLEESIVEVRDAYNPDLELAAVIPCEVPPDNAGKVFKQALELLHGAYEDLVTPSIRRSPRVAEALSGGLTLPEHAAYPPNWVTKDYIDVIAYLQARGVLPGADPASVVLGATAELVTDARP